MPKRDLYEEALEAIKRLFNDKSIPQSVTKEKLKDLQGEIDIFIDALR